MDEMTSMQSVEAGASFGEFSQLKNSIKESEVNEILDKLKLTRPGVKQEIRNLISRMNKRYDEMENQLSSEIRSLMLEKEKLKKECNLYKMQVQDIADDKLDYVSFIKTKQLVKEQEASIANLEQKLEDSENAMRTAQSNETHVRIELEEEKKNSTRLAETGARYAGQIDTLNRAIQDLETKLREQAETYAEYQLMHTSTVESLDAELSEAKRKLSETEGLIVQVAAASDEYQAQAQKLWDMREEQARYERMVKDCRTGMDYSIARLQKLIESMTQGSQESHEESY